MDRSTGNGATMHILIADDDKDFSQFLAELLEARGHEVEKTSHALAAYKKAQRHYYELFVIDAHLPIILGTQLAEALRELWPGTKIILISPFPDESISNKACELGAPVLSKPFAAETILELIASTVKPRPL